MEARSRASELSNLACSWAKSKADRKPTVLPVCCSIPFEFACSRKWSLSSLLRPGMTVVNSRLAPRPRKQSSRKI